MSGGLSGPKAYEIRSALGVDRNVSAEVVLTGTQACEKPGRHWVDKPNAGYSGTPMWKLALERAQKEQGGQEAKMTGPAPAVKIPEGFKPTDKGSEWYYSEKRQVFWRTTDGKMYVWDNNISSHVPLHEARNFEIRVAVGSCFHESASQVRHVLVRDLQKAGQALRMSVEHLDRPCTLYALYEGHRASPASSSSGGSSSGNLCAEFCAKGLHQRLLPRLAAFRGYWEDNRLAAAMRDSFEELEKEFADRHAASPPPDGCCAAVALITGGRLVVASLGDVACVVCLRGGEASELLRPHRVADSDDEEEDEDPPGLSFDLPCDLPCAEATAPPEQPATTPRPPVRWTRAFGDLEFKAPNSAHRMHSTPDVKVLHLQHTHQGFAFICRSLYNAIGRTTAVSTVFKRSVGRPRMASGMLVDAAVQWLGQVQQDQGLGAIVAFFDRIEAMDSPTPLKRMRTEAPSQVRLRHILLKHRECKNPVDKVRNKQVRRLRSEAERLLRAVLEELSGDPKVFPQRFTQRCREVSECQSCLKSGELAGDLGWAKPGKFGQHFDDVAFVLQVGQLSDLVDSDQGVHVVLRTA